MGEGRLLTTAVPALAAGQINAIMAPKQTGQQLKPAWAS